jgi:hypothetical protein
MCTVGLKGVGLKSKSPSKNWSKINKLQEKYDILPEDMSWSVLGIRDSLVRIRTSDQRIRTTIFFIFLSYNLPAGTLSSVLKIKFFAEVFCVKILFCSIISVLSTPL